MKVLISVPSASYSVLKLPGIESNLFLYHLQQLIKLGLVEKIDKQYKLTLLGKQYSDRSSLETMLPRVQPKVVSVLVITDPDGNYLILERLHQPFIGTRGFPSGKVHFGEALEDSGYRELEDKAGITRKDVTLTMRGNLFLRFLTKETDEVVNHIISYVFTGTTTTIQTTSYEQPHFRSYWGPVDDLHGENTFKGHREILRLLEQPDYFVEAFDFESTF